MEIEFKIPWCINCPSFSPARNVCLKKKKKVKPNDKACNEIVL